jgi:hypothetical protein
MTREEMLAGLQAGGTLVFLHEDHPLLPMVHALVEEGLAVVESVPVEGQVPALHVRGA